VIHYARLFPGQSVDAGVTLLSAIALITSLFSVLLAGLVSDRLQSRKPFVITASILLGLSLLILAFVHSWPATIVAFVLIGIAFGAYSAVDSALVTQVLPRAEDRGKDMGVIGIALSLAQFIAPSLGALAISLFAPNVNVGYTSLYLLAAVLTFLGALLVLPIKGVR
jgi:MFS family permease